ncbi:MAG TPA: phosphopantothenoylcysteine decarboxylase [Rectinemataceae bacterium]|nr:phosphopantothenoylcysteine decarboxylase [Rectinemataceae bacterium]
MSNILIGVTGSIAAYKAADIVNLLTKRGHNVDVILTEAGSKFITALTLQTLSKNRVLVDLFDEDFPREVKHISLAKKTDLLLVAPATADVIAKFAYGFADDMLTSVALALGQRTPVLLAPAMNTNMWNNPAVKENLAKLAARGWFVVEPKEALLACGDLGKGALADVEVIVRAVEDILVHGAAAVAIAPGISP